MAVDPEYEYIVRLDSSTMWVVARRVRGSRGARILSIPKPTMEELERWSKTCDWLHSGLGKDGETCPETGGRFVDGAYRNEADEEAVLARWKEAKGIP